MPLARASHAIDAATGNAISSVTALIRTVFFIVFIANVI